MDLIDRQAAIEAIDAVFPVDPMKSEYAQGIACGAALAKTYVEQLSPAQPERVWSELDKQLIDDLLRKIYELQGTSLSMDGVIAKKYYINELYGVLFGRGEKPKWMT